MRPAKMRGRRWSRHAWLPPYCGVLGFGNGGIIRMPSRALNSIATAASENVPTCVNNQRNFGDSLTQNSQRRGSKPKPEPIGAASGATAGAGVHQFSRGD
jgi:hypothetical protein